jgi:hypothetical protein
MTPEVTAVMAIAEPLIHSLRRKIVKLPGPEQQRRIAKVLAAMRGDA